MSLAVETMCGQRHLSTPLLLSNQDLMLKRACIACKLYEADEENVYLIIVCVVHLIQIASGD